MKYFIKECIIKFTTYIFWKGSGNLEENKLKNSYHRSFAYIDLDAVDHNFDELKKLVDPSVKVLSIVKADAYGHGSAEVAKHLEGKTDFFAVSSVGEGVELRKAGIKKPVLILSYTSPFEYNELLDYDIRAAIYNFEEAKQLSELAAEKGKKAVIHIALDTGMGRIGFQVTEEAADTVRKISELPGIEIEGLFSHYSTADMEDKAEADKQTERFDSFLAMLEKRGVEIPIKHICNSAGTMEFSRHYDMVRLGVALYGLFPSDEVDQSRLKLQRAMQVISHVIHVKTVEKGTAIGYGRVYIAPEQRKIATVCIGYADGYNRAFTGKGYVLINGKKAPVVGKVCMDQIMVDVSDIENVKVGDEAVILGRSGSEEITAEELGAMVSSFGYEVICNFMPRVTRVYKGKRN